MSWYVKLQKKGVRNLDDSEDERQEILENSEEITDGARMDIKTSDQFYTSPSRFWDNVEIIMFQLQGLDCNGNSILLFFRKLEKFKSEPENELESRAKSEFHYLNIFNSIFFNFLQMKTKIRLDHCCTLRFLISRCRRPCESPRRRGPHLNKFSLTGTPPRFNDARMDVSMRLTVGVSFKKASRR